MSAALLAREITRPPDFDLDITSHKCIVQVSLAVLSVEHERAIGS